ncbi:MAG: hypothetical protein AAGK14_03310 [Verrucomicrobiota bacterium]
MNPHLRNLAVPALLALFCVHSSVAEDSPSTGAGETTASSQYELDEGDRIPPVPILRLQEELNRDLDQGQIQELKKAHQERKQQIVALNQDFIKEAAEITGLTESEILGRKTQRQAGLAKARGGAAKGAAPKGKRRVSRDAIAEAKFVSRLELIMEHKGENMTGMQKRKLDRIWEDRSDAVADIQMDYAREVAAIANVSLTKVKRMLHLA